MRRREFITLVGGAAAAWPVAVGAQQAKLPVVGFLNTQSPGPWGNFVAAFRQGLRESGLVEGRNIAIEFRWAENRYERLPVMATELADRGVSVIAATGGGPAAFAAKAVSTRIPIVFVMGDRDPVMAGLVASLNRPGGNITGVIPLLSATASKRLGLLHEMVPTASLFAMITNPNQADAAEQITEMQQAASTLGRRLLVLNASTEAEIDAAFSALVKQHADALIIASDPFLVVVRAGQIAALATRYAVPTMFAGRNAVPAGGLMSYAANIEESYRIAGTYTARILKGEKAADLPVVRSSKFELAINLNTAKAIGIDVPPTLLAIADEVIE
jgi:putative ABC transport system substrate-binding protein